MLAPAVLRAQAIPATSRLLVGELAIEVAAADSSRVRLAVADAARTVVLVVLARDAKRFADSVASVTRARRRARRVPQEWRVTLEEPGVTVGSFSFTRRDDETGSTWRLFAADKDFDEVRGSVNPEDVQAVMAAVRRHAQALLPPPAPKRRSTRQSPRPDSTIRRNWSLARSPSSFDGSNSSPSSTWRSDSRASPRRSLARAR